LDDIHPAGNIALAAAVGAHGDHGAMGLKPYSVVVACRDLNDIRPAVNSALSSPVSSNRDHGAVGPETHSMIGSCRDLDDLSPVANTALPVLAVVKSYLTGGTISKLATIS
jgi:hypothetical protein